MSELYNQPTLADILDIAEKLGETSGEGDSALPTLAYRVASGVRDGAFVNIEVSKGKENDIHTVWKRYAKGKNAKAPAERSQKSIAAQVSKLQSIANAAKKMNDFAGDVMVRVQDTREKMVNDKASKTKTWPLFDSYVNAARLQCEDKNVGILNDDLVTQAITKVTKPKTLVEHLQALQESVAALKDGESAYQVDSAYHYLVEDAERNLDRLVTAAKRAAMTPEQREEADAMAAAREDVIFKRQQAEKALTERALDVADAIEAEKLAA